MFSAAVQGLMASSEFFSERSGGDYDERSREWDDTPCLHNSLLHHEQRHYAPPPFFSPENGTCHTVQCLDTSQSPQVFRTHINGSTACRQITSSTASEITEGKKQIYMTVELIKLSNDTHLNDPSVGRRASLTTEKWAGRLRCLEDLPTRQFYF